MDSVWIKYEHIHMRQKRIIIYPKDVQRITGKSERHGRVLIDRIKQQLRKEEHQVVTVQEFADYMGIDETQVNKFID